MMSQEKADIPWVEKYRPTHFDNIVLDQSIEHYLKRLLRRTNFQIFFFMDLQELEKQRLLLI